MDLDGVLLFGTGLILGHVITKVTYDSINEYELMNKHYRHDRVIDLRRQKEDPYQELLSENIFTPKKPRYKDAIRKSFKKHFVGDDLIIDIPEGISPRKYLKRLMG
ncbi:hypothetical protein COU57_06985 [Candidatus Pacearchaeota archaeon CG10_big_fil_rev_8_21_14_0_10_32_14]|nr:MAG: hypothetical protein COU57_06985 [Candidatus Pacearchaeota archaeon CG10_big_fil_rev_8_21_14_0_10_32_14]